MLVRIVRENPQAMPPIVEFRFSEHDAEEIRRARRRLDRKQGRLQQLVGFHRGNETDEEVEAALQQD